MVQTPCRPWRIGEITEYLVVGGREVLQNHFLNNVKFLEAVQLNSSTAQQLVQG